MNFNEKYSDAVPPEQKCSKEYLLYIAENSAYNKSPQHEALGNKPHKLCSLLS